jgi:hypothetical protein
MMQDKTITTTSGLRAVLDGISFAPSCLDMGWQWEIEELWLPASASDPAPVLKGWLVNTTFRRPDTHTGIVGIGRGRKEFVPHGTSESGAVKTAWLLAELIVRHELMEAFLYRGVRIFDPHHTVEELSMPHRARTDTGPAA